MSWTISLLLAFLALLTRTPSVTLDIGAAADWVSGLGSLAAVIVALHGFKIVERQRASDRDDAATLRAASALAAEKGIAYELAAALSDMANNLLAIRKHFATRRNDVRIPRSPTRVEHYKMLQPLIGLSDEGTLKLPAGSTELLVKAGAIEFWNDIRLLANRNRSITTLMIEYRTLWENAISKMPIPEDFTGTIGHLSVEGDLFATIKSDLIKIDSMVGEMIPQVEDTAVLLTKVSGQIGPIMTKYFKSPFLHFEHAEDENPPVRKERSQSPE